MSALALARTLASPSPSPSRSSSSSRRSRSRSPIATVCKSARIRIHYDAENDYDTCASVRMAHTRTRTRTRSERPECRAGLFAQRVPDTMSARKCGHFIIIAHRPSEAPQAQRAGSCALHTHERPCALHNNLCTKFDRTCATDNNYILHS